VCLHQRPAKCESRVIRRVAPIGCSEPVEADEGTGTNAKTETAPSPAPTAPAATATLPATTGSAQSATDAPSVKSLGRSADGWVGRPSKPRRHQGAGGGRRRRAGVDRQRAEVLRDLRRRGMQAPVVAVGDGAFGLWAALRDVFPTTRQQRDWVRKVANVLAACPLRCRPGRARRWSRSATPRPQPRPARHPDVRPRLRREVAQGGGQDHRRRRGIPHVLRLPGRALVAPEDQQPDLGVLIPHQLALREREVAGWWWLGPDSESDCCYGMDGFELGVSGSATGRGAADDLA